MPFYGDIFSYTADTVELQRTFERASLGCSTPSPDQSRPANPTFPSLTLHTIEESEAADQRHNAGDMMRIITLGDYKTVNLSCFIDVVANRTAPRKWPGELMGVLRRKGRTSLRLAKVVCPEIDVGSSNEHHHLVDRKNGRACVWRARKRVLHLVQLRA